MRALIIVDVQNDFLEGGTLAVPNGNQVIPAINGLMPLFDFVVATQDWHPAQHKSFADNNPGKEIGDLTELNGLDQVMWPTHCVEESRGAELSDELNADNIDKIIRKGNDIEIDSYSGFFDNGYRKSTGLTDWLKSKGVTQVTVTGLATDYCVKFTALDAVKEGFTTTLVREGCRGVELNPGDVEKAIEEMKMAGITVI